MSGLRDAAERVERGGALGRAWSREALGLLVAEEADSALIKRLLLALNARGFGEEELAGFAEGLLERAVTVPVELEPLIDTCGTGGDGLGTFNLSTAAAFVAAGGGVAVAKHGNRSVSSRCGSADLLEALGLPVEQTGERVRASLEAHGFGFFFAPLFHPALRRLARARRELGVRTIFNLLGPLVNPARVRRQVVGIYAPQLLEAYARVLLALGAERVLVLCAEDGMDELSLAAPTRVCTAEPGRAPRVERVCPEDLGLARCAPGALGGGGAAENARLLEGVLAGEPGPLREATLYNAAAAFVAAGAAGTLREGLARARESLAFGKPREVLERLRVEARP